MELLIDSQPGSVAANLVNEYSRANTKILELSSVAATQLKLKLPLLVRDLAIEFPLSILTTLLDVQRVGPLLYGSNSIEKAQTSSWVEAANTLPPNEFISLLENKLLTRTFLVSNHITIADLAAYAVVQPLISSLSTSERLQYVCVLRWAAHLQTLPGLKDNLPRVPVPERNYGVPHAIVKGHANEEAKQAPVQKANPEEQAAKKKSGEDAKGRKKATSEEAKAPVEKKKAPQAQKEKAPAAKKEANAPQDGNEEDPFQFLDIRVGRVERVWKHPEADRLFVEEIDLGTEKRTVVSGLVGHVTEEEFTGSFVAVLCNLKKSKLKGVVSEAMVLAAKHEGKVELLRPPQGSKPGDVVTCPGVPHTPSKQLPPAKKYWENSAQSLNISGEGVARYRDLPLRTENGELVAPTLKAGTIS